MKLKDIVISLAVVSSTAQVAIAQQSLQTPDQAHQDMTVIEVTGELLSRNLQQTGNSVVVIDSELLAIRPELRTVRDILSEIPNITMVTGTGKAPSVRGVDGTGPAENANAFFAGSRPRLNWQIDGRSATYNEIVFSDIGIWDLKQVEVLRGPQSTLAGRNAIAGTVRVQTNDPTFEQQFAIRVEGGNLDQKRASVTFNQPLTDTLSFRIAADKFQKRSPVSYDAYPGVADPADIDGAQVRAKLMYLPKNENNTRLVFTLTDNEYSGPNGEIVDQPFAKLRSNFPAQPVHVTDTQSLGVEFSHDFYSNLSFEAVASITDFTFTRKSTPDGSKAEVDSTEHVIEPRIRYTAQNGSEVVIGTRWYQAKQDEWIQFIAKQSFKDDTDGIAAYVEGAVPLSDKLELTAGLRYEKESRQRSGGDPDRAIANIEADNDYSALLPKLGLSYELSDTNLIGLQFSRGYNAGGGGITFAMPIVNYSYDEEYVNSLELYGRQQFLNGDINTSVNFFYSDYKDMQLPFDLTPNDTRDEAFVVRNAEQVQTIGAEFTGRWALNQQLSINSSLALLDSEISKYPDSGLEGNSLIMVPSLSMKLGASWQAKNWVANVSSNYTNGWYTTITNLQESKTDGFISVDASFNYYVNDDTKLYLSIRNLLDNDTPIALYPGTAPTDSDKPNSAFDKAVLNQPRTISAGFEYHF
ncbi:Vitamin B12 transporter BtuB [Pseudoalteromonas holothuriae]|uniref:Vitamin B12 transporter BtuB n=1 Tax=Pseudoalteromonas holothuriae TaxID=2963714 RepID=A0A9W4QSJ7_9GAMM|nr:MULTISPECIES: TonB-dependent receptor [unclassified Pseudoalteromonas]CAH9051241.1 Vitamin B12 transporter BtuB [Pseudoalteromonas sp. CIP111854]CAH9056731.1 Vitamin B12 transporter BtuB [Pseudoalteromonas sp. CIP111951]